MMDLHETFEAKATAAGAMRGGLKKPGDRMQVTIRQFSKNWMVPASPADRKKMVALQEGLDEFNAAKAADLASAGKPDEAIEVLERQVKDLEEKLVSAEKSLADETKRADKAESDLAALNKKIDDAQEKAKAAKSTTTASKTTASTKTT